MYRLAGRLAASPEVIIGEILERLRRIDTILARRPIDGMHKMLSRSHSDADEQDEPKLKDVMTYTDDGWRAAPIPHPGANYLEFSEIATPITPGSNELRLYAKDSGGVTRLFYVDSSGVERGPL